MFCYVIEVLVWSFAIYGFIEFMKENMWEFVDFLCKMYVKFVAKKNR